MPKKNPPAPQKTEDAPTQDNQQIMRHSMKRNVLDAAVKPVDIVFTHTLDDINLSLTDG